MYLPRGCFLLKSLMKIRRQHIKRSWRLFWKNANSFYNKVHKNYKRMYQQTLKEVFGQWFIGKLNQKPKPIKKTMLSKNRNNNRMISKLNWQNLIMNVTVGSSSYTGINYNGLIQDQEIKLILSMSPPNILNQRRNYIMSFCWKFNVEAYWLQILLWS